MSKYLNEEEMIEWFMNLEWDWAIPDIEEDNSPSYLLKWGNNDTDVVMDQSIYSEDAEDYLDVVEFNRYSILPLWICLSGKKYIHYTKDFSSKTISKNLPNYLKLEGSYYWTSPHAGGHVQLLINEVPANCITKIDCSYLQRKLFYYDDNGEVIRTDQLKSLLDIMQKDYTHKFKGLRMKESPETITEYFYLTV